MSKLSLIVRKKAQKALDIADHASILRKRKVKLSELAVEFAPELMVPETHLGGH